jgi:hypothetical protein
MGTLAERSEVAICNAALFAIGDSTRITSLDDDTVLARLCKERYPRIRDALLRAYPWNFAAARASLAADPQAPPFEFITQYTLPSDFLWLRELYGNEREPYQVEGGYILCNVAAPLEIKYTRRVDDPTTFDDLFAEALAARLAAELCAARTESASRAQALFDLSIAKIMEARRLDAQEGRADALPETTWLTERL